MSRSPVVEAEPAPGQGETVPSVGVAIVSWNVRELVLRCLATVLASPDVGKVVVVDNDSADGTADAVRAQFPDVTVIANRDNRGFAAANNQAFRALGDALPYTLILNPDTELVGDPIPVLRASLESRPKLGGVGPRLRYGDGSVQSSRRRFPTVAAALTESTPFEWHWPAHPIARRMRMDDVPDDAPQTVDWLNGAAILFRRAALEEVGGFDEGYFLYSEELDLCRRLAEAGWTMGFEPAAEVLHLEGKSSEQVVCERHVNFLRSRVRYVRRFHGRAAAVLVRAAVCAMYGLEWAFEAVKWLVGHKRAMRRERMTCYGRVVREV